MIRSDYYCYTLHGILLGDHICTSRGNFLTFKFLKENNSVNVHVFTQVFIHVNAYQFVDPNLALILCHCSCSKDLCMCVRTPQSCMATFPLVLVYCMVGNCRGVKFHRMIRNLFVGFVDSHDHAHSVLYDCTYYIKCLIARI